MVNDLNDIHYNKPKLALKGSESFPLTNITVNPLDIISPPPFCTKRPTRLNTMTRFKSF